MKSGGWRIPKEKLSKTANELENIDKPEIVVFLRPHASCVQCLMLCIENIGTGAAHNVQFSTGASPAAPFIILPSNSNNISLLKKYNFLQKGINCFGPGQKIEQFLISLIGGLPEELKQPFQIFVTYRDLLNHTYENEYELHLGDFESLVSIDSEAKNLTSDLKPLLDAIQAGLSQVAENIERSRLLQTPKPVGSTPPSDEEVESSQPIQSEPDKSLPPELQELVAWYNAGEDSGLGENYTHSCSIGVSNEDERLQNPNVRPVFQTTSNGSFDAYAINSENSYAVVPFSGLILQNELYSSGAFGEVFECPSFDPEHRYHVKVVRPALFKQDPINDTWTLKEKGRLELKERDS